MKLIISSLFEMRQYHGQITHVLSMVDPDDAGTIPGMGVPSDRCLVLACDDIDSRAQAHARERAMPGSRCIVPTAAMVRRALEFARPLPDSDTLLVHCGHGISRSTALAFAILAQAEPGVSAPELFQRVLELRPQAEPNLLIIKHADAILRRQGSLSRAIAAR